MVEYAPCIRALVGGERISCVASMVTFDGSTVNHLMSTVIGKELFSFSGSVPQGRLTYSLLNVRVARPVPRPLLVADEESHILHHDACSWESVREVIELCAGYGGLGQGLLSTGFSPQVACDVNPLMTGLYQRQMPIHTVTGDITKLSTVAALWEKCPRSTTLSSGISCQPYSALGDGRSGSDPRSLSLPATLACAHYLRSVVVVIECVEPAQADQYVMHHIRAFCQRTGFHFSDVVLRLQHIWPCARNRWWCILSAPALGPIRINPWPILHDCTVIKHVLPYIIRWPSNHEDDLALLDHELEAFQVDHEDGCPYAMNRSGVLPCPLHAWGSQLRPCPCKCRSGPLSQQRLQQRGLFGVVVKSAPDMSGKSRYRHIHPYECGILVGQDPTIDFGEDPLLTLSAAGQIASPLQSAWVGAHIIGHFEELQRGIRQFNPLDHLQALRTLLIAKSQALWPYPDYARAHAQSDAISTRWGPYVLDRIDTILNSDQWDFLMSEHCLAGVLQQLQALPPLPVDDRIPFGSMRVDSDGHLEHVSVTSDEPEPEITPAPCEPPIFHVVDVPHDCAAIIYPPDVAMALVHIAPGTTVQQLLEAEGQLHGFDWSAVSVFKSDGSRWAMNDVIVPGQLAQLCVVPSHAPAPGFAGQPGSEGFPGTMGHGPMHAHPEFEPDRSAPSHQVCLYVPNPEMSVSGILPPVVSAKGVANVALPGVAGARHLPDPTKHDACQAADSGSPGPQHGTSGECGPLPFKLPTDDYKPVPEGSITDCLGHPRAPEVCHGQARQAIPGPAGPKEAPASSTVVTDVSGGLDQVKRECGPLPCKLPTDATSRDARSNGLEAPVPGHSHVSSAGSTMNLGPASPRVNHCPMVGLDAEGLMRLGCSYITTQEVLQSMLGQVVTAQDRCLILANQGLVWADDELRWHLVSLLLTRAHHAKAQEVLDQCAMIDPLLMAGWVATGGENCETWVNQFCSTPRCVATIALIHNHWVPIVMIPRDQVLHVHTWDSPTADHQCLESIFARIAGAMGLLEHQTDRLYRMFPMHEGCGAMAVAFIAYMLHDRMLPANQEDVHAFHAVLRSRFIEVVQTKETCTKPWKWANGCSAPAGLHEASSGLATSFVGQVKRTCLHRELRSCAGLAAAGIIRVLVWCLVWSLTQVLRTIVLLSRCTDALPCASVQVSESHARSKGSCHSIDSTLGQVYVCQPLDDGGLPVTVFDAGSVPLFASPDETLSALHAPATMDAHDASLGECGPLPALMPTSDFLCQGTEAHVGLVANMHISTLMISDWTSEGEQSPPTVPSHATVYHRMQAAEEAVSSVPYDKTMDSHGVTHPNAKGLLLTAGLPAPGECGPLPFKLPTCTQTRSPKRGEAQLGPGATPHTELTTSGVATAEGKPLVSLSSGDLMNLSQVPVMPADGLQSLLAPTMSVTERCQILEHQGHLWADDEIRWHLAQVSASQNDLIEAQGGTKNWEVIDPLLFAAWTHHDCDSCETWVKSQKPLPSVLITVATVRHHWVPIVLLATERALVVHTWDHPTSDHELLDEVFAKIVRAMNLPDHAHVKWPRKIDAEVCCGSMAVAFIVHILEAQPLPSNCAEVLSHHARLRAQFVSALQSQDICIQPRIWANGPATQAEQELVPVLIDHGVPQEHATARARAAVRAIGAQPVLDALGSRIPWKQLKTLGNQEKFQFLLPAELQAKITAAAGKGAIGRPKGGKKSKKTPPEQPPVVLDPAKFSISPGVFQSNSQPLQQKPLKAVGPATEGIVIVTKAEAAPYLAQGKIVSNLPLALLVLQSTIAETTTSLPHNAVTVPCRCVVNQEPMLIDMIMVQIGTGLVEKAPVSHKIHIDTVEVGTLRLTVFRDEIEGTWEQLIQGPMKYVVHHFPLLRSCREPGCHCPHWHNHEKIDTKDALVDVWRRQYLRNGYKPEPPSSATMFAVSIRVPSCLVMPLLKLSGTAGIYAEPRSLDSRTVHEDYAIVWLTRLQPAALNHLCQTNPTAIGLARVGDRIGLRTLATHASELSKAVRPDAVYLPAGPKQQYLAGPFPFGTDRGSLTKALQQIEWEARPLQPLASIDNKGAMWLIQATEDPPASLLSMGHGDIMISKHKGPRDIKETQVRPVATPATIALCNSQTSTAATPDPWSTADPWGGYAPSSVSKADASEGLKQLESKIQQAVLASLPATSNQMEVDDVPDRVLALEQQMQAMAQKHAQLEATVSDHAARHTAQLGSVQHQLQTQGAELRGHIESQQQNLQALFESQMSQIRSLLKRPREDHE